ncbi:MAG: N-acetylmuramoyl-L-alanine amidase [Gemmatimonadota bacterium]
MCTNLKTPVRLRPKLFLLLLFAAACAPAARLPAPAPIPDAPRLPPVPSVRGELDIEVVYPGEGSTVAVRDSTFIFGNVGRGDASLTINGAPVDVAPNGAWLAFLPVPSDGVYRLAATAEGRTVTETRTVEVPAATAAPSAGPLRILEGSASTRGVTTAVRGERIDVSFRGTPGASARLVLPDGTVVPLVERQAVERSAGFMLDEVQAATGVSEYVGTFPLEGHIVPAAADAEVPSLMEGPGYVEQRELQAGEEAMLELARGGEVVRIPLGASIGMLEPMRPRVAVAATARPDSMVIGRRQVGSDQAWDFFWPNGTLLPIDGEASGFYRVRLTSETTAWVSRGDVRLLPPATPQPSGFVGPSIEMIPRGEWVDIRFSMSERLPFRVDPRENRLSIEFYGATGRPAYVGYGPRNEIVELAEWEQVTDELFRFSIDLVRPLWGFRYRWEGSRLILQVRRPPDVDPARPLAGLRIGVDAGHRGSEADVGAVGPTGLREVDANLDVARSLIPMLERAGAEVVAIRTDETIVPLIERPIIAERNDAHLLISIHFNAFPDGVDPFENHGTTNFYFWPHSLDFARHMQRELLVELGLPDRGVRYQNLGMTRTTWMPSILTETLFMMFPEQEAALRNPDVIERIADAHLRAMESFVLQRAAAVNPVPQQ